MDLQIITISLIPFYKGHLGGNCSHGSRRITAIILWEMPLKKTVGQLTKIQLPLRRPQQRRFSGSLRIRENSLTLFPFSPFTLIPYFFSFLFFPALRRVDFFEKMALMLNFIKTMKELSVISWEGGVILWVVKLLKKLVSLLLE